MTQAQKTRERVYHHIVAYIQEHGYPPTYQEIADATGLASKSSAAYHIAGLVADGRITQQPGSPRALRLCEVAT